MRQTARMALRNLTRQKKRTILLAAAIAFGVMIVSIINGFAGSFVQNVSENLSQLAAGHVFMTGQEKASNGRTYSYIRDDEKVTQVIKSSGIGYKYLTKRSSLSGTAVYEGNSVSLEVDGVIIKEEGFLRNRLNFISGSLDGLEAQENGVVLSQKIADKLGVSLGSVIGLRFNTYKNQASYAELKVAGIVSDPNILSSGSAYGNFGFVNKGLELPEGSYQQVGIIVDDASRIDEYGAKLYVALKASGLPVFDRPSQDAQGSVYSALNKQFKNETWEGTKYWVMTINDSLSQMKDVVSVINLVDLIILLVLFLIIMVGILNTFRMIMFERIREIGTMRAVGVSSPGVLRLFLTEAVFLSLTGALAGLAVAGIFMGAFSLIDFGVGSPLSVFLKNGHFTFALQFSQVLLDIVVITVLTALAALAPARKAARLSPAAALRTQK
jgi:putative ABC transport system permease protein